MDKQDKPRLAEVLGVEEDQEWIYEGRICRIHDGYREAGNGNGVWQKACSEKTLADIINHPESIIHLQRLTEAEIAIMRAVGAKWVSLDTSSMDEAVALWSDKPENDGTGDFHSPISILATVTADLFPSVKPGECIGPIDTSTTAMSGN